MPVKRSIPYTEGVFFITFTCYKWLPLFELVNGYDIVYKWFDFLKQNNHYIVGYVIMPNHLHAVIGFQNTGKKINTIIGNGKRFMAYEIIARLKQNGEEGILLQLEQGVKPADQRRGKLHEVWEDSFDWKECRSDELIMQKLHYMHVNPSKGKWNLAVNPVEYIHSSAKFYITGEQGVYAVTSFMELNHIDLSKAIHT